MPAAKRSVRLLHLEDNPRDAGLIRRQLEAADFDCNAVRAGTTEYLLKHRLQRLAPAVERALDETVEQKPWHYAEIARRENEDRFRSVAAAMHALPRW